MSARIVVDASVSRAASGSPRMPAPACLAALEAVLEAKLVALTSSELLAEWSRHQSDEFTRWLRRMHGRKLVSRKRLSSLLGLNARLSKVADSPSDAEAMIKDAHLVAAGIEYGG